jgi:ribosome-binding factor A
MSRRTEMLGSTIQKELAQIIMRELNDPRLTGMPSITRVKVSPDLSIADVYVTIMGTQGQQNAAINALRHSAGMMRTKLTKVLTLRQAPYLKFHIDENLKKELAVLETLRIVAQENEELDRKRAEQAAQAEGSGQPQEQGQEQAQQQPTTDHRPLTTDTQ